MKNNGAKPKFIESDGVHVEFGATNEINRANIEDKKYEVINEIHSIELNDLKKVVCDAGERVKFEGLTDLNDKLPPIPDGGWGWVVVASAFLITVCIDGVAFSFGLLQVELATYFNSSISKTSLIGAIFISAPLLSGPIMSALVDKYGCRIMTMIAGLISTIGFLLAAVSNSVEMLCLTYGLMSGLAIGILYVTAVVPVAFWFEKKRNFAVSLSSGGIGVGTLVYSPLTYFLLNIYDWRNTLVILAGTLLNMCVCGTVMRDPDWLIIKQTRKYNMKKSIRTSSGISMTSKSFGGESSFFTKEEFKDLIQSGKSPEYILHTLATTIAEAEKLDATTQMNVQETYFKRIHSHIDLPTFIQQNEKVPVMQKLISSKIHYNILNSNNPGIMTRKRSESIFDIQNKKATQKVNITDPVAVTLKINKTDINTNEQNKEETISLIRSGDNHEIDFEIGEAEDKKNMSSDNCNIQNKNLNKIKSNTEITHIESSNMNYSPKKTDQDLNLIFLKHVYLRNYLRNRGALLNLSNYKPHATSLPNIYQNSTWSSGSESEDKRSWYTRLWNTILKTFNFKMFNELHFMLFNLSSLILSIWLIVPYFFLTSFMSSLNLDGGALMLSVIGIASCVGILVLGWAGDQPWINVPKVYALCIIICGLSVASYPLFITNFWALAVISSIFGLTFASCYTYIPTMLLELIPVDLFTVAYGMFLFSEGIGHLIGPPLAGLLFDISGKWELTFYVGGFWIVISGLCVGIISYTKNIKIFGKGPVLKDLEDKTKATEVPIHAL